jgi:hypothetical protein
MRDEREESGRASRPADVLADTGPRGRGKAGIHIAPSGRPDR